MIARFQFKSTTYLDVKSISIIGSFNEYHEDRNPMTKSEDYWYAEIPLTSGEHYYKFLINNEFLLNDPEANMYLPHGEDELWSTIIINEQDQRLYNNEQYSLHIDSYAVSSSITPANIGVNKKNFNLTMDKKVVVRFGFTDIKGLHAVTTLWYNPNGKLHDVSENMLFLDETAPDKPVFLWFWLNLEEKEREYPEGMWTVKLFIDGSYIMEDQVMLTQTFTYSSKGHIYNV